MRTEGRAVVKMNVCYFNIKHMNILISENVKQNVIEKMLKILVLIDNKLLNMFGFG